MATLRKRFDGKEEIQNRTFVKTLTSETPEETQHEFSPLQWQTTVAKKKTTKVENSGENRARKNEQIQSSRNSNFCCWKIYTCKTQSYSNRSSQPGDSNSNSSQPARQQPSGWGIRASCWGIRASCPGTQTPLP